MSSLCRVLKSFDVHEPSQCAVVCVSVVFVCFYPSMQLSVVFVWFYSMKTCQNLQCLLGRKLTTQIEAHFSLVFFRQSNRTLNVRLGADILLLSKWGDTPLLAKKENTKQYLLKDSTTLVVLPVYYLSASLGNNRCNLLAKNVLVENEAHLNEKIQTSHVVSWNCCGSKQAWKILPRKQACHVSF